MTAACHIVKCAAKNAGRRTDGLGGTVLGEAMACSSIFVVWNTRCVRSIRAMGDIHPKQESDCEGARKWRQLCGSHVIG
jgi:hypothetical protein